MTQLLSRRRRGFASRRRSRRVSRGFASRRSFGSRGFGGRSFSSRRFSGGRFSGRRSFFLLGASSERQRQRQSGEDHLSVHVNNHPNVM
jgi:hypothetical protein